MAAEARLLLEGEAGLHNSYLVFLRGVVSAFSVDQPAFSRAPSSLPEMS